MAHFFFEFRDGATQPPVEACAELAGPSEARQQAVQALAKALIDHPGENASRRMSVSIRDEKGNLMSRVELNLQLHEFD